DAFATVVGTLLSQTVLNLIALGLLSVLALGGVLGGRPLLAIAWPLALIGVLIVLARLARPGRFARPAAAPRAGPPVPPPRPPASHAAVPRSRRCSSRRGHCRCSRPTRCCSRCTCTSRHRSPRRRRS